MSCAKNEGTDKYGNLITDKIVQLHQNRTMLAVYEGTLLKKKDCNQSHKDWFLEEGWILSPEDITFKNIIRGYFDKTGIYFYKGEDFGTDAEMECFVKNNIDIIRKVVCCQKLNIYCGLVKGRPGEKYKPLHFICSI